MIIATAIDRFGVKAVTGKDVIRPGLIKRIAAVENIIAAYQARAGAENWATFGNENPGLAALLVEAERCANANDERN